MYCNPAIQKHLDSSMDFTLRIRFAIMVVTINKRNDQKGGGRMAEEMSKEELMKISVEEFSRIQDWMLLSPKDSEAYKRNEKKI